MIRLLQNSLRLLRRLLLLCCLAAFAALLPGRAPAQEEKDLTLMIYMAGSDLETQSGAASADIQEMLASGCDFSRVNLVVLTGGAQSWQLGLPAEELSVLHLGRRGMRTVQRLPLADMGAPETLSAFLTWAREEFPARNYALIFWDHGGGPMEGVCFDELHGRDRLTLAELRQALESSPFGPENRLSWIGFDACLMASLETASACTDFAEYMIASQETEPSLGWNYSFLAGAAEDPTGAGIGRAIVDAYMAAAPDNGMLTLSCVDLDRLGPVLLGVTDLFNVLREGLNAETFSILSNERRDAKSFGRITTLSDYDLADLYHLSECYAPMAPAEAAALQRALNSAVLYSSSRQENAHGLSIYSPYYNKHSYSSAWMDTVQNLSVSSGYTSWIRRYASFWLADQLADWSGLAGRALPVGADGVQTVELSLNREQQEHFASAKVVILRDQGFDRSYYQVYEISGLVPENGTLRANYDFSGLFLLDENGNPVSDIYPFHRLSDGQYSLAAELEKTSLFGNMVQSDRNDLTEPENTQFVNLICTLNEDTGTLEVRNVIARPEDPNELTTGKQYVTIAASDYPYIFFSANRYAYFPVRDEDTGRLLPYTQWTSGAIPLQDWSMRDPEGNAVTASEWIRNYHEQTVDNQDWLFFSEVDNGRPWSLQFLKGLDSPQRLYAQFIVTDTQGVENATELIPLHFPAQKDTQAFDLELFQDERAAVALKSVDVVKASAGSGLYFRFQIENHTDRVLNFLPANLTLNSTAVDRTNIILPNAIEPHSVTEEQVAVLAADIPYLSDRLTRVGFTAALWPPGEAERYTVQADPLELETDLDLSSLDIPTPGAETVWAEAIAAEDLAVRLLDLQERRDGSLEGLLHLVSRGAEPLNLIFFFGEEDRFGDAIVNGCFLRDVLHASGTSVILPPGGDLYVPFTLSRTMQLESVGGASARELFSSGDGFTYWGVTEIRRLVVPLVVGDRFLQPEFVLPRPFPLSFPGGESAPSVPLLEGAPVSLSLRAARAAEDGSLRLEADIRNDSGRPLCFRVSDCTAGGARANALLVSETYVSDTLMTTGWLTVNPSEGNHRILISLKPEAGAASPAESAEIAITFETAVYPGAVFSQSALDWERSAAVRLLRQEEDAGEDGLSGWEIRPGGMLPEISLSDLLGGSPAVPEIRPPADGSLRLPLSEDQRRRIQSALVSLVLPCGDPEQPDACYALADLPVLRLEDGNLTADFNGLLAAVAGNALPFYQVISPEGDTCHYLAAWLELQSRTEETLLLAEHIHLTLSGGTASAFTRQYDPGDAAGLRESPTEIADYLEIYRIPGLAQGMPAHWDQWEYLGMTADGSPLREDGPSLVFRPASDWKNLYAVFSVTDQDGSRWAASMPCSGLN